MLWEPLKTGLKREKQAVRGAGAENRQRCGDPVLSPCINCSISDAVKIVYEAYKHISVEYGTGNVAVAGCSSGGDLALALVSHINVMAEGVPMPELLYVASPEMCIRTPEERALAEQLEKSDIIQSALTVI